VLNGLVAKRLLVPSTSDYIGHAERDVPQVGEFSDAGGKRSWTTVPKILKVLKSPRLAAALVNTQLSLKGKTRLPLSARLTGRIRLRGDVDVEFGQGVAMIKQFVKRNLPAPIPRLVRYYKNREFNHLSTEQIFVRIYERGIWGRSKDPARPFFSGSGSNRDDETAAYVREVSDFLCSFPVKPSVVDLGCGDFAVGSRIRKFCGRYVACDVVPSLIAFNKRQFENLDVEFRQLDLIEDELPVGDVALVRQVLQHLSNDLICRFVTRASVYKFLIVTEHLPSRKNFKHNADKLTGPGTRMGDESGIVLTSPPFNLRSKSEREICRVKSIDGGVLVTVLYRF
jgi:SAM-dependent methyltransferase